MHTYLYRYIHTCNPTFPNTHLYTVPPKLQPTGEHCGDCGCSVLLFDFHKDKSPLPVRGVVWLIHNSVERSSRPRSFTYYDTTRTGRGHAAGGVRHVPPAAQRDDRAGQGPPQGNVEKGQFLVLVWVLQALTSHTVHTLPTQNLARQGCPAGIRTAEPRQVRPRPGPRPGARGAECQPALEF